MRPSPEWHQLTEELRSQFTQDGEIAIRHSYRNDQPEGPLFYSKTEIEKAIQAVHSGVVRYRGSYSHTTPELYECLNKHPIKGKTVAIIGSVTPWYEAVCLAYGGIPTTIEYNKITTDDTRLKTLTVEAYNKNPVQFDAVFSISSYEHDGLGRYGDPVDPKADLKSMRQVRDHMLKKGGLLYLAVPIGKDTLYWNGGRIYGRKRWFKLIDGFEMIYAPNSSFDEELDADRPETEYYQPTVVLQTKN